jgi:hypothetical protein
MIAIKIIPAIIRISFLLLLKKEPPCFSFSSWASLTVGLKANGVSESSLIFSIY